MKEGFVDIVEKNQSDIIAKKWRIKNGNCECEKKNKRVGFENYRCTI